MSHCIVHFGADVIRGFETWDELRDWLERAEAETGVAEPMLDLIHESGSVLTIALGATEGALDFTAGAHYDPYFAAVGNSGLNAAGATRRFTLSSGEDADVPRRNVLPRAVVIAAVEVFFNTGARATEIPWDEDAGGSDE